MDLIEIGLFDNVHILGVLVLLPYMVMFVNSTLLNKSLFRLLFAKLFWDYLMHISKTALTEIEGV